MAANIIWRVVYAFRDGNKRTAWDGPLVASVIAADSKEDTIRAVLVSNNIVRPGATIEIVSVSKASVPGGGDNVLS